MKINNSTRYSSDDLRAIISAVLKHRGVPASGLSVDIVPARRNGRVTGRALIGRYYGRPDGSKKFYYGRWMKLVLPHEPGAGRTREELFASILRVTEHEVAHLQGLHHTDMSESLYDCAQDVSPWSEGLVLRFVEVPDSVVLKEAAAIDRSAHARTMLKKAETRMKRAETIVKKWRRRVARIDRGAS